MTIKTSIRIWKNKKTIILLNAMLQVAASL